MAIKQYSLKNDGAKQLSPAFRVREFRCRDGTDTILIDEGLVVAADIQVQDTDPLAVAAYAESLMPGWGGVGRYPVKSGRAKGWVHVDTRPNKSRWTL